MGVAPSITFGESSTKILTKGLCQTPTRVYETATIAGGCFWGIELVFQRVPGVVKTEVGHVHDIDHAEYVEAVQVTYDVGMLSYEEVLTVFWDIIDPTILRTQSQRQQQQEEGNMKEGEGAPYYSCIYYHNEEQRIIAERTRKTTQLVHEKPIMTGISPITAWRCAEECHQHYLQKHGQSANIGDTSPILCNA